MKKMTLGTSDIQASVIGLGCMRMEALSVKEAERVVRAAQEQGINFFDHADVYGGGESERIFAKAVNMNPTVREGMLIQSKCGIRKDGVVRYDFSEKYILDSVDGILERLNTEYLDTLLLHRPDALMEPEEVASAFDKLYASGKVRCFGVSNESPRMVDLLRKYVKQPLIINQLQFSLAHTLMIDQQIFFNTSQPQAISRESEALEYCRLKDITVQAWSPFQYGFFQGSFIDSEKYPELNAALAKVADAHNVSKSAIAVAWILRHPAKIQTIIGSMNPERIAAICKGAEFTLSREEWYELYEAAGNDIP